jgi:16S rRNA (guanine966-N2)-methyltransferase
LDAFAGTGALGLEALSRNAELALFLEPDQQARRVLAENIRALGEGERGFLLPRDATKPGPMPAQGPFDLVFADAPYGTGLGSQALAAMGREHWFINGALAVLEMAVKESVETPEGFISVDERSYGRTRLVILQYAAEEAGP